MPKDAQALEHEFLAIRCQLGESEAFEQLVARWHTPLWRYIRRMADRNELADELLQETWLRVLQGIAALREPASLVPWMFGIARRVLMDRLRQKYTQAASLDEVPEEGPSTASAEDESDLRDEIGHMLQQLDRIAMPQRELLTLYYLDELSIDGVAQVLGIPVGTVKSRLFAARKVLKQTILTADEKP
jgi:RNA polymerase sigma-70 factor (ECF subfamily)